MQKKIQKCQNQNLLHVQNLIAWPHRNAVEGILLPRGRNRGHTEDSTRRYWHI